MSAAPVAPPAVWAEADRRPGAGRLLVPDRHVLPGRAAEAAARPHRAGHPGDPADPLAAHLRHRRSAGSAPSRPADVPYLDYLAPGIIAQSALFIAIFYGIQIIWERDAGVLTKLLATPTPRVALVAGKAFAAGVRAIAQAIVVMVVAALLGVGLTVNPLKLLGVVRRRRARHRVLLAACR